VKRQAEHIQDTVRTVAVAASVIDARPVGFDSNAARSDTTASEIA
jgi:hypothetical protein